MPEIRCLVEPVGNRLVLSVSGELSLPTVPRIRTRLLKCLAEEPEALVVDLRDTTVTTPLSTLVFAAVADHAALWPGIPLVVSAPPAVAEVVARSCPRLPVFASMDEALAAEDRHRLPSVRDRLLPLSGVARHARRLTTAACDRWDLPHLAEPGGLIAAELVHNATEHAGTMADLRLTLGARNLIISVRDGSCDPPRLPAAASAEVAAPRGLLLVQAVSSRWGSIPVDGGKVVWATLPLAG
ncbi:STAS domain-containing protein [Actinoplanes sp. URMC 104]|uniref:STAS domain-containing protein n=1 Tax=Actinoplanes sp. URMC 104 TaxID=3423409 RepID=UPI003F19A31C